MAHDVFVSYAGDELPLARRIAAYLEAQGITCWIAARDAVGGADYGQEIVNAIEASKAVLFLFSASVLDSNHIPNELERATSFGRQIVPFRVDQVLPNRAIELWMSRAHWLDAARDNPDAKFPQLAEALGAAIKRAGATPSGKRSGNAPSLAPWYKWSKLAYIAWCAAVLVVLGFKASAALEFTYGEVVGDESRVPGLGAMLNGDTATALPLLERAAENGNGWAAETLAAMYIGGIGVRRDDAAAVQWLERGVEEASDYSRYKLGVMLLEGQTVQKNTGRALKLFAAVTKDSPYWGASQWYLATYGLDSEAAEHHALAAAANFPWSHLALAKLAKKNGQPDEAKKHMIAAAAYGSPDAETELAMAMLDGDVGSGFVKDEAGAFKWARSAARQGSAWAQKWMAYFARNGRKDEEGHSAAFWSRYAAEQGDAQGMFFYAQELSARGRLFDAYVWYLRAASRGDKTAASMRDQLERLFTADQRSAASTEADRWRVEKTIDDLHTIASGTGVFVGLRQVIATNEHVIAGCGRIGVVGPNSVFLNVSVIGASEGVDLALLSLDVPPGASFPHAVARLRGDDGDLGESVTVFGYPLTGELSRDGVLTTGTLSALSGYRDDQTKIQISAPVQPGNSGGGVFDTATHLVGIVQSRLSPDRAQNVNFAVKASVISEMLGAYGYRYLPADPPDGGLPPQAIARFAKDASVRVLCLEYR
jgi:TPR repeat protein